MVKCRHAIDAAGRQLELVGNEQEQIVVEKTEQFLGLVQHLDQRGLLVLVFLHVRFKDFEALVTAGVLQDFREPAFLVFCNVGDHDNGAHNDARQSVVRVGANGSAKIGELSPCFAAVRNNSQFVRVPRHSAAASVVERRLGCGHFT